MRTTKLAMDIGCALGAFIKGISSISIRIPLAHEKFVLFTISITYFPIILDNDKEKKSCFKYAECKKTEFKECSRRSKSVCPFFRKKGKFYLKYMMVIL